MFSSGPKHRRRLASEVARAPYGFGEPADAELGSIAIWKYSDISSVSAKTEDAELCYRSNPGDFVNAPPVDLDEDVYALAISDLTRDFERLAKGDRLALVHVIRMCTNYGVLVACICAQIFLIIEVRKYVSRKAVHDIRIAYDEFEMIMYGNDTSHMFMTINGFHRGIRNASSFFNIKYFAHLTEQAKEGACKIPLSEPYFCGTILWIWSTLCMGKMSRMFRQFMSVIVQTKTCESNYDVFERDEDHVLLVPGWEAEPGTKVIYQLTAKTKCMFIFFIMVPRGFILSSLLWLGCRWLLATNNFSDLLLNGVSLEFILELSALIHEAMAPSRNRYDLASTKLLPPMQKYFVDIGQAMQIVLFNALTFGWVFGYMLYFQNVLPDYQWDVHDVCQHWIKKHYDYGV